MPEQSRQGSRGDASRIPHLIDVIIEWSGKSRGVEQTRAIEELAAVGAPAVEPILEATNGPFPKKVYDRDAIEDLIDVLVRIARIDPKPLTDIVFRDATTPHPQIGMVLWALGCAPTLQAIEALLLASKHRDRSVRLHAIAGLIELRDQRSIAPVIRALRDRASMVQFTAVEAINSAATDFFRVPEAAEPLRRLLQYKNLEKRHPGTFHYAKAALEKIEAESMRR